MKIYIDPALWFLFAQHNLPTFWAPRGKSNRELAAENGVELT